MSGHPEQHDFDPTRALEALANDGQPPSGLDILRAAHDGHRLRVRRRVVRALTGATAAGALAAAALLVPPHLGGPGTGAADGPTPSGSPGCPTTVGSTANTPGDYTAEMPAHLGWIPPHLFNEIDESLQTPQFGATKSLGYSAELSENSTTAPQIYLTVSAQAQNSEGVPDSSSASAYTLPGPVIDGHVSHWTTPDKQSIVSEGQAELSWTTSQGCAAELQSVGIDAATADSVLPRIAASVVVGVTKTPMPFQIVGMPASAHLAAGPVYAEQIIPGSTGGVYDYGIVVGFLDGSGDTSAHIIAYPAASFPGVPPGEASACKVSKDLKICIETDPSVEKSISADLPGGMDALLAHVVSLGTNPANWSPDVITGTH